MVSPARRSRRRRRRRRERRGRAAVRQHPGGTCRSRARRLPRLRQRVHRLRRRRPLPLRLPDRPSLRLRPAPARGRGHARLPERGALRGRARGELDRGPGLRRGAGRVAACPPSRARLAAGRRPRARLRDAGARLPGARSRRGARRLRRAVRPRARRQERARAPFRAREHEHQRGGLLAGARGLRARPDRGGDHGALGLVLRRSRHGPARDEHGSLRRARPLAAGVQDPQRDAPGRGGRPAPLLARDRRPGRPLGRVLARADRGGALRDGSATSRATRSG